MSTHTQEMTPQELRKFGVITGILIILLVGTLLPWIWGQQILEWQKVTGTIGSVFIMWGLIHPSSLIFVYKPWMTVAEKIGWFNTRIIMALIFYVMFVPLGLIMRVAGYDPLKIKLSPSDDSYRILKESQSKDHMETPY
jgi:hypothetical protein